jgi:hypothetical protein
VGRGDEGEGSVTFPADLNSVPSTSSRLEDEVEDLKSEIAKLKNQNAALERRDASSGRGGETTNRAAGSVQPWREAFLKSMVCKHCGLKGHSYNKCTSDHPPTDEDKARIRKELESEKDAKKKKLRRTVHPIERNHSKMCQGSFGSLRPSYTATNDR